MAAEFSWTPPLVVLALGAVAGAVVVAIRSKNKAAQEAAGRAPEESRGSDLQRRYDAIIRRLAEGGSPEEKAALELEAARILMEVESGVRPAAVAEPASASPSPGPTGHPPKPASAIAGFLYGVLAMGTLGGLVYLASSGASLRQEGGSPTGGNTMGSAASSQPPVNPAEDAAIAALEESVRKAPTDIAQRVELTRAYLQRRDLMKVFDQTQAILEVEPGQPHALTYQALVRVAMGQADQAETMLIDAIKKNPRIEDAYIHLAIARLQLGNRKGAEEAIQAGQKEFPEDKDLLANVFAQISSASENPAAGPAPEAAPEAPGAPGGVRSAPASSASAVVVIDLPKGLVIPKGAMLFVIAREAGLETGPPIAVKRLAAVSFPITVTLSEKDSMAGESLPGLLRIEARVDSDGDPMTRDPRDPFASEDNVRPGAGQLLLVLSPGR